ncbi:MAG TPA: glycosyltransferase family 39 protein [Candidatus Paceibacterota bacterium]|nr:glycosyltransferase family 39 protein [Candidatus Paceibacterota bacterium]
MTYLSRLRALIESGAIIWLIVAFAFLVRIAGVHYGLPQTLVDDEPPFVLGALQMLQTHTIIPALHASAFKDILYYPPYLCYVYLLPFAAIAGAKYLMWHGGSALFAAHLGADLSSFFMAARIISALLGAASVWLVYQVSYAAFKSRAGAAISAFLLATSLIHESLSMVGRHWLPISLIFLFILYLLTRERMPENRRIFWSLLVAGIGMGVSTFSGVAVLLLAIWFFTLSHLRLQEALRDRWTLAGAGAFVLLAPLPSLIYPYSQGFLGGVLDLHQGTSALGIAASPLAALMAHGLAEPVLIGLAILGSIALWFGNRRWFAFLISFFIFYALLFYCLAIFEPRFLLPLVPLYALLGGYAWSAVRGRRPIAILMALLLLVPLASSLRLAALAYEGDTRQLALQWELSTLSPSDKILVFGNLMRFPVRQDALDELRSIDPGAVRKTDEAEASVGGMDVPYALNLYAVHDQNFLSHLAAYARAQGYEYLVYTPDEPGDSALAAQLQELASRGTLVAQWDGFGNTFSVAYSAFTGPLPFFFEDKLLGPSVAVYKLK